MRGGYFFNVSALCFLKVDYILLNTTIWLSAWAAETETARPPSQRPAEAGIWNPPLQVLRKKGRKA